MATTPLTPTPGESPLFELDDIVIDDDQDVVAAEIRALMGRYKVSQSRLSQVVGVSRVGLSDRLAGKTNFTIREIGRIARFFRRSTRDLFPDESGLFNPMQVLVDVTRNEDPLANDATEVAVQMSLFEGTPADTSPAHITFIEKEAA